MTLFRFECSRLKTDLKKKYSCYDIWICVFRKVERRIKKRRSRLLFALLFLPDGGALCWFFVGDVHLLHFLEDCFSFVVLHFILQLDQVSAKPFLFSASLERHQKCNFTKEKLQRFLIWRENCYIWTAWKIVNDRWIGIGIGRTWRFGKVRLKHRTFRFGQPNHGRTNLLNKSLFWTYQKMLDQNF